MDEKDLQSKQKFKYNVSLISLTLFPSIQIVRNWVIRNTSTLIIIGLFKTIIRIIWKVATNVICFTVSSSDDLEISLVAVNLTTMKVAEWHAACGIHINPLNTSCPALNHIRYLRWSRIAFSNDQYINFTLKLPPKVCDIS